jgi:proteasome lid subunit RPN8/RPN11
VYKYPHLLKIKKTLFDAIRRHGQETYPHECCGVLVGELIRDTRVVHEVVRCGNTRTDSPANRYHIDPVELISVQKRARELHLDLIGFYHSHPDHPALWSQTDLDEAHWFGCSYVITSIERGLASRTRSYVLRGAGEEDKRFDDEPIQLLP